jgi:hypothetical protein
MLITLSGVPRAAAGAASGVVNTAVQLGIAAGPATIGTVFFNRLAGSDFVGATQASLLVGVALFAAAACACALLPRSTSTSRVTSPT